MIPAPALIVRVDRPQNRRSQACPLPVHGSLELRQARLFTARPSTALTGARTAREVHGFPSEW